MKTPDYLSYDRYKKKKSNPKNNVSIFVTTFFVTLLLFTVVAKSLSPNVDVSIGDDSETDAKETGLGVKKFIDERLKMIQMDDNSNGASNQINYKKTSTSDNEENPDSYSQEPEEKVTIPKQNNASETQPDGENVSLRTNNPPRPKDKDLTPFSSSSPKMSKVLVGRYATIEQAKVAQEILLDSDLNVTPFIKNMGDSYTLQVGSYSSKAKADGLASELQRNNFPARIIQE